LEKAFPPKFTPAERMAVLRQCADVVDPAIRKT